MKNKSNTLSFVRIRNTLANEMDDAHIIFYLKYTHSTIIVLSNFHHELFHV